MILSKDQTQDHGHKSRNDKSKVNLEVGEHDEPTVAVAALELPSVLSTGDRPSRVLASNTDTDEKAVCGKSSKHTILAAVRTIGARTKSGKDEKNDGGDHQRPLAGVDITGVAKDEHADDSASEGNGGDILTGRGVLIGIRVKGAQDSVHLADNLEQCGSAPGTFRRSRGYVGRWAVKSGRRSGTYTIQVSIREKTSTACDGRPTALPATLGGIIERRSIHRARLDGTLFLETLLLGIVLLSRSAHYE